MADKDIILLVEDDPEIARILLDHLRREGYAVTWASSGLESWEDFRTGDYQRGLLDTTAVRRQLIINLFCSI